MSDLNTHRETIERHGLDIEAVHIRDILSELGHPVHTLTLGTFDEIGEITAKKRRSPSSPLYASAGCFFRPNYERGLLIYSLVRRFKIKNYLEVGFGRGYSSYCAALGMLEEGMIDGVVTSIDVKFDKEHVAGLSKMMPTALTSRIRLIEGPSSKVLPTLDEKFDMIFLDGDHTYDAVKADWEACKDKWKRVFLFDDYHLPTKSEAGIECAKVIDQIDRKGKRLVISDRRIFLDDRGMKDADIDYGQVLMLNEEE